MTWQLQTAMQKFSELVNRAQREGPQVVTKHGREAVVVLSIEDYRRLRGPRDDFVAFLRSAPDFDLLDLTRSDDLAREHKL